MADNVWAALVKGSLGFAHSRAGELVGTSFNDTGALVTSLFDNSPAGTTKSKFETLKDDIQAVSDAAKPVIDAVQPEIDKAKTAVTNMANELGTSPFTIEAAGRAATELAFVLIAFDAALDIIADKLAEGEPAGPMHDANVASLKADIKGIDEPWKAPFRDMAAALTAAFDSFCTVVLGVSDGGKKFADLLSWSRADKKLTMKLVAAGPQHLGPLDIDGASLEAFFSYLTTAKVGLVLKAKLQAGLGGDPLLKTMIAGTPPTADTTPTAITLDSTDGLTFGEGKSHKIVLPIRFSFPGIELREFAIAQPDGPDKDTGRIDVMVTIAGKLGSVLGVVAENGGVTLLVAADGSISARPKPPSAAGLRLDTGIVKGGGYMRYTEATKEYGGVLDLQFTKIGVTAIGLIGTEPFSLVIVIGVHFLPKIDLGFGFTLNGLGGIIAIERSLAVKPLSDAMKDGGIGQLLFPENPVDAAPQILDRLASVFPPQKGGFVVGPIGELGWGSQAGFLKARVGIVLSLPDPKLVLLGAMQIGVPSADVDPKLRIVDIHAELLGVFTADYFFLKISIANSKIAGLTISGDIGILVRWSGGAAFALSVGGFFPKYIPPPELADLRRIAIELSPPVDWITLHVTAYIAVTSNTIQFGGGITLNAKIGPVSAKAWLTLDALFQWSPRFYFIFIIDAGIELKAFGVTVAGVKFHGELSGTHPWHLEGSASVEFLFWSIDAPIGPIEWGEKDVSVAPPQPGSNNGAVVVELSVLPEFKHLDSHGNTVDLAAVATIRAYSRLYPRYVLGSATGRWGFRESERFSGSTSLGITRDLAADTPTVGIDTLVSPQSVRTTLMGGAQFEWRPNARTVLSPSITAMRSAYDHSDLLRETRSAEMSLPYARTIAPQTTIGLRPLAGFAHTAGQPTLGRYALFATFGSRFSPVIRLNFDLGAEHVPGVQNPGPGLPPRAAVTRPAGTVRVCAQTPRLDACLSAELGAQVSALDGYQRTKILSTSISYRLRERRTLVFQLAYQRFAAPARLGMRGELQALGALTRMDWRLTSKATLSGEVGYTRRASDEERWPSSVYAGLRLRLEPKLR